MKKKLFLSLILLLFITLIFQYKHHQSLNAQGVDDYYNKKVEKKWGFEDDDNYRPIKIESSKIPSNLDSVFPIYLEPLKAQPQTFQVNPAMENKITGKYGTEITIPGNTIGVPAHFRNGDVITIELIEILNDLDFITLGVDMLYYDGKSKPHIFESGGMFKLKAIYYNRELNLKRGAKVKVQMPLIPSSRSMKIYHYDREGRWIERGKEQLTEASMEMETSGFRFFGLIDKFGLWNFDHPNPDITCVQGTINIEEKNPPYTITVIGQDYSGAYSKVYKTEIFKINAIQSKKTKILAADARGNLGYIDFTSPSEEGFVSPANFKTAKCGEVGTVSIKKVGPDIRNDRSKLLNFLGLTDRF